MPDPLTVLTAITGTSVVVVIVVFMTRQRADTAVAHHSLRAADDADRALWALAQVEDKLTAALEWMPLGYSALSGLELRRGMRNVTESLGHLRDAPEVGASLHRLRAHIEGLLARPGIHPGARQTAAHNAIEEIQTLRRTLEHPTVVGASG